MQKDTVQPLREEKKSQRKGQNRPGIKRKIISNPTPSTVGSIADAIVIKDGGVFFVSKPDGTVPLDNDHGFGLYLNDCRYLSGYHIQLGDTRPHSLVSNPSTGYECLLQLCNEEFRGTDGSFIPKETLSIRWKRIIDKDKRLLADSLVFQNFSMEPREFSVSFTFDATFEDVFVVRGFLNDQRGVSQKPVWSKEGLAFHYVGKDDLRRAVRIHFFPSPSSGIKNTARYDIRLAAQEAKECVITVALHESPKKEIGPGPERTPPSFALIEQKAFKNCKKWLSHEARVKTDSLSLDRTITRSLLDLKMLENSHDGHRFFSAGIPWFASLFGRDSLITALQTLAYDPTVAEDTLRLLAKYQGQEVNAWRDESPGKILHELRVGELARTNQIPHTPYFGTVDATPLFLILLARHAHWTGSLKLFQELRGNVERALTWMKGFGDLDGDGYLKYDCQSSKGLANQGWKDSGDGIMNRNGSLVVPPISLVEVQGYLYDAKKGIAGLYRIEGQLDRALELEAEAEALKDRFNREFWLANKGCYALALQKNNQPAAVIASNAGHALWSGIATPGAAKSVMQRLLQDDMFNGWGIRTLSQKEKRYNPLGYHLGSVWPHDNALIASGFKRYGFNEAVLKVFTGIFRASTYFENSRLPELFAGFSESEFGVPVHYPVACHPQAWAAATIPHLIETLLGLSPEAFSKRLRIVEPVLPGFVDELEFRRLRVGDAEVDLGFSRTRRGSVSVEVLKLYGELDVVVEPISQS